jgi:hypothetical protein
MMQVDDNSGPDSDGDEGMTEHMQTLGTRKAKPPSELIDLEGGLQLPSPILNARGGKEFTDNNWTCFLASLGTNSYHDIKPTRGEFRWQTFRAFIDNTGIVRWVGEHKDDYYGIDQTGKKCTIPQNQLSAYLENLGWT